MLIKKAFTLIELLVVISIIALLIAILLPALAAARQSAEMIQCASDQRQLGVASNAFAADGDGLLPDLDYLPHTEQHPSSVQERRHYYMNGRWKQALGDYGAIRENWYSVTNSAWNDDSYWRPGDETGTIVFGRFAHAGDRGRNFAQSEMVSVPDSGYDGSEDKPAFAKSIEDNPVFRIIWSDLARTFPAGSGYFNTPGSTLKQGANHISDDPTQALGTHHTEVDGSTTFVPWAEMKFRGEFRDVDIWW